MNLPFPTIAIIRVILLAALKLVATGCLIGLLHRHDLVIACILAAYIAWRCKSELAPNGKINVILVSGMVCTALYGSATELWGIRNNHWTYHDLSDGRTFPYWLPLAWALSFYFMYRLERQILTLLKPTVFTKFIIFFLVALIFPVIGEIVTIALGVWDYHWPWKIAGVPILAMVGLIALHMPVNGIFLILCKALRLNDPVFSRSPAEKSTLGTDR